MGTNRDARDKVRLLAYRGRPINHPSIAVEVVGARLRRHCQRGSGTLLVGTRLTRVAVLVGIEGGIARAAGKMGEAALLLVASQGAFDLISSQIGCWRWDLLATGLPLEYRS